MSIFSSIVRIAAPIVGGIFGGPAGAAAGSAFGAAFAPAPRAPVQAVVPVRAGRLPILPPARGLPPGLPRVPGLPVPVAPGGVDAGAGAGGACPAGFHLNKVDSAGTKKFGPRAARSYCVRNRRMNQLNGRAANRAIRRIKGARKMLQKIERQLPKAKARRTPAHGHRTTVEAI